MDDTSTSITLLGEEPFFSWTTKQEIHSLQEIVGLQELQLAAARSPCPPLAALSIKTVHAAAPVSKPTVPIKRYADEVNKITAQEVSAIHRNTLIHLPRNKQCPPGYVLLPHAFHRGEETWDGCKASEGEEISIDFLLEGETFELPVPLLDASPESRFKQ
jgi:hypothetical protein